MLANLNILLTFDNEMLRCFVWGCCLPAGLLQRDTGASCQVCNDCAGRVQAAGCAAGRSGAAVPIGCSAGLAIPGAVANLV